MEHYECEDYDPTSFMHVDPKKFAWHDPEFRARAKVGDILSFLDCSQFAIRSIDEDGVTIGWTMVLEQTSNPEKQHLIGVPQTQTVDFSWDELIEKEAIIVSE